ncbi:MAG: hypothetical protein HFJ26_01815 [Clostridia bacterium]|nr:hypothetical protein [Clostridia bacterium]
MGFISKKRKINIFHKRNIEREFALSIVEIFEEKLEELRVNLPEIVKNEDTKIKDKVRNELVYEIENFVCMNKSVLVKT